MLDKEGVRTVDQMSAGGVAYRPNNSGVEVAIVKMIPEMRWQLPKGVIDEGETIEEAALREVREEAGIKAELVAPIETIEYWFYANRGGERVRYHKFVHFFLMKYLAGDVNEHDHEIAEARWATSEDALKLLAFKSEREVLTKGVQLIK